MPEFPNQQPLFRNTDPETSRLAAEKFVAEGKNASHERNILGYLFRQGLSRNCAEIANGTGLEYHAVSRRMKELETRGLIKRAGTSINSGRPMTEWEAVRV